MPIKSYLAYPLEGKKQQLAQELANITGCEIIPSTNTELIVLVTETADEQAETELENRLKNLMSLQCLTMVSGFGDHA
ncbi:MAG: hypothetical protein D6675_03110 [Gemmatimonadetes bacterium]|nr:MAG: hypothetical protein D6675_03110 [Gemmatimonadota bacterium]